MLTYCTTNIEVIPSMYPFYRWLMNNCILINHPFTIPSQTLLVMILYFSEVNLASTRKWKHEAFVLLCLIGPFNIIYSTIYYVGNVFSLHSCLFTVHLGYFHVLTIINSAAVKWVQMSLWHTQHLILWLHILEQGCCIGDSSSILRDSLYGFL